MTTPSPNPDDVTTRLREDADSYQMAMRTIDAQIETLSAGIRYLPRTALADSDEVRDFEALGDSIVVNEGDLHAMNIFAPLAAVTIDLLRRQLAEAERIRALMAKDWMDFCEEMGVQFDTQEAVAYELRARREPR